MSDAQKIKAQVKRAGCKIESFLEFARAQGADIDIPQEAERIRLHLKDPKKAARTAGPIPRKLVTLAGYLESLPRPQELLRTT